MRTSVRSASDELGRMPQPDVRLDVRAITAFEPNRRQRARHDVVAVLGELQLGPLLPLLARARDRHRARSRVEHLRTDALVRADPRVVVEAVLATPLRVVL